MEISPRRSLSLDFDASIQSPAASSYPPTYYNCKPNMYTMQGMKPVPEPKVTRSCGLSSSLSMDSGAQNVLAPKKENFISNIFNAFTSVIEHIGKVPVSFTTNISSTLSVTVVPNEGIISSDFFKTLTRSSEQLASEHQSGNKETMIIPEILPKNKSFSDAKSPYVFTDYSRIDAMPTKFTSDNPNIDEKSEILGENELDIRFTPEISQETEFCHENDVTMKASSTEIPAVDEDACPFGDWTKVDAHVKEQSSKSAEIGEQSAKGWHTIWQRDVDGLSDRLSSRAASPEPEVPIKKPNLADYPHTKPRRKICSMAARGRGKGRGKSQLRRSGVSQSRHRKERTKQNIFSNIQDDLEAFEDSESYDSENDYTPRQDEEKNSPRQENWKHCSTLLENFAVDGTSKPRKRKQRLRDRSVKCPLRVVYVRESMIPADSRDSLDVDDCLPKIPGFRPRLVSESSVESDDSYCIVFENNSESESNDYDFDSDTDEDLDEAFDDEGSNTQRVRFNLKPQVHMMVQWDYAYRAARRGPWEEMARDRERFRGRIRCIERILEPVLVSQHRKSVWQERFDVDG